MNDGTSTHHVPFDILPEALHKLAMESYHDGIVIVWVFKYNRRCSEENEALLKSLGFLERANEYGRRAFQELMNGLEKEAASYELREGLWWNIPRDPWDEHYMTLLENEIALGPTQWYTSIMREASDFLFQDEDMGVDGTEDLDSIYNHLRSVAAARVREQLATAICVVTKERYYNRFRDKERGHAN